MSRLANGGLIDRSRSIPFTFDGESYCAHPGDTVASALLANGVRLMGRSFKYHRPRGVLTAGSEEPNALIELGTGAHRLPNTRATTQEVFAGLTAQSQNRWPSLKFDLKEALDLAHPFLGAGFYYKTFMWPKGAWHHLWEPLIRRAADEWLPKVMPRALGPHEGFVVKPRAKEGMGKVERLLEVEFERRPAVLALGGEACKNLLRGGAGVGQAVRPRAKLDQRVWLFGASGEHPPWAVILEAPAHQPHAVGQKRRGHGIARVGAVAFSVKGKRNRARTVDQPAICKPAHCPASFTETTS